MVQPMMRAQRKMAGILVRAVAGAALALSLMMALGPMVANGAPDELLVTIKGDFKRAGTSKPYEMDSIIKISGGQIEFAIGETPFRMPLGGQTSLKKSFFCDAQEIKDVITTVISADFRDETIRVKAHESGSYHRGACAGYSVVMIDDLVVDLRNNGCKFSYTRSINQQGNGAYKHVTRIPTGVCKVSGAPTAGAQMSCLEPTAVKPGIACDRTDSLTIAVYNRCDAAVRIRLCLGRRDGTTKCTSSVTAKRKGEFFQDHVCSPDGKMHYEIVK
jgi:hypothetical protein